MTLKLLCLSTYPKDLVASWVTGTDVDVTVVQHPLEDTDLKDLVCDADIIIGDAARRAPLSEEMIGTMERCRHIIHPAVGLDGVVDLEAAKRRGITVSHAPGYNSEAVADWVLMSMLLLLRDGVAADRDLRLHGWSPRPLGHELGSVEVGIVGFGAIGQAVAARLKGFGTVVRYTDLDPDPGSALPYIALEELVETSDVITLHTPLVASTKNLVDDDLISRMRRGSVLINAARGGLVDTAALVRALESGQLSGAALDVFDTEPLPADSKLFDAPNLYLSPHVAAGTEQARERVRAIVGRLVAEAVAEMTRPGGG